MNPRLPLLAVMLLLAISGCSELRSVAPETDAAAKSDSNPPAADVEPAEE